MGKKIKKLVKKAADPLGVVSKDEPKAAKVETPVASAPAPTAAQVEAPKEDSSNSDESDTESAKKAARARGKRGLSVARSSGSGLNI